MSPAAHNRLVSAALVALFWGAATALWPTRDVRDERLYWVVATLGYGHLAGGVGLGAAGRAARRTARLGALFALTSAATGFCAYSLLLVAAPIAAAPFALLSTWHAIENDRQLAAAYRGSGRMPPVSSAPRAHAWLGPAALAALALAACAEEIRSALGLPPLQWRVRLFDLYGAPALYHVFSWLVLLVDRARREPRRAVRRRRLRALAALHAVPLAVAPIVLFGDGRIAGTARDVLFGPQAYLYWSSLHVIQTALARRSAARADPFAPLPATTARGPAEDPPT